MGPVREADLLPESFRHADAASLRSQRRATRLIRWQLLLLTAAAALGSARGPAFAWAAAAAFLGAALPALRVGRHNPQGRWYEGRAAAESVKTLAWKFAVRADLAGPTPAAPSGPAAPDDPEGRYALQLRGVLGLFGSGTVPPGGTGSPAGVTAAMRGLREQPLTVRREVYLRERVRAQHQWYREKAGYCDRAGRLTELLGFVLPVLGLALAVARALGWCCYDALGTIAAVTASVTAWAQLRQYRPLAAAYRLAADELELVHEQLARLDPSADDSEGLWARLARDAEDAVSREHTTWQARREVRGPAR
ncbi:DUF4231 domain-containing protein [Kitasatospora sp. NBC_01287]|uniref:DUF4231 domain-containing protein n=1 Tax=Kitasatospora sp. NBC_01287 TaxID=2903573 RepID=UPI0022571224|nr:DUF4231 domain-containing protein [Kitasatospora sp. NBC_01287]MCX4747286.1 DUF4231 domain-containing protein [Kitasatospora sp. NBC_01287]